MIREASIYALKRLGDEDLNAYGLRVLTMRRWPQGIRRSDIDLWVPSAGPTPELLLAYRTGKVSWDQFLIRYLQEQEREARCRVVSYEHDTPERHEHACRSLDYLAQLAQERGTITVLCWEQNEHCHRFALVQQLTSLIANRTVGGMS